jgi:hypothetical protein
MQQQNKNSLKEVFITSIIMVIATVFMLLAAFIFSEYNIKNHNIIEIPGEIEKPQVQQELMEIKKVGE